VSSRAVTSGGRVATPEPRRALRTVLRAPAGSLPRSVNRPDPRLLARLHADLRDPIRIGEPHVVVGWTTAPPDGRQRPGGAAVLGAEGHVLAVTDALWVTLSADALSALLDPLGRPARGSSL